MLRESDYFFNAGNSFKNLRKEFEDNSVTFIIIEVKGNYELVCSL